jgi:hypothetical protein
MPDDVANLLLSEVRELKKQVDEVSLRLARIETRVTSREKMWNLASGWLVALCAVLALAWNIAGGKL